MQFNRSAEAPRNLIQRANVLSARAAILAPSPATIDPARDLRVEPLQTGGDPLLYLRNVLLKRQPVGIRAIERSPAGFVSLRGIPEGAHVFVDQTVNGGEGKLALAKLLPARGEALPKAASLCKRSNKRFDSHRSGAVRLACQLRPKVES